MKKMKKKVNFDICTFCNHRCTFCSNSDERTIKYKTSLDEFRSVMQNVLKYVEMEEIGLSAKGEVLVNQQFLQIVQACKKEFCIPYVYISTNGAMMDVQKATQLIEAGLDSIKFSINALTKEEYIKVHGVDDFQKVITNFKALIGLKRTRYKNIKIFLSSIIDGEKGEIEKGFMELLGEEDFALLDGMSIYTITYTPKFDNNYKEQKIISRCSIPFRELYINANGTLGLCCKDYFDEVNFGSLIENDFLEVYHSKAFEEVRNMHKTGIFPDGHLCKKCLLFDGGM
jgi:MoaA/NifB/PqqE/SkfB family radical SAM enzyme